MKEFSQETFVAVVDEINKRNEYWRKLRVAREVFLAENPGLDDQANIRQFCQYAREKFGIKVVLHNDFISQEHEIVDEQKYLMFLLKYE